MTHTNKIGIAILLTTLSISHFSFAASCYEQSPIYVSMGDKYFDLYNKTELTANDQKIINSAIKKIIGNWKGKGETVNCIGSEFNPIVETRQFTLSASMSTNSSNELHIDVDKNILDDKTKSQEHLFFFGDANNYRTVSITPNKIVLAESFRQERREKQGITKDKSKEVVESDFDEKALINSVMEKRIKIKDSVKKAPAQSSREEKTETKIFSNKKAKEKFRPFYELIHTIEHSKTHFNYSLRRYINGSLAVEERWQLVRN